MKRKRVQTAFEYNNLEPRQLLATTPIGLNDMVAAEVIQFTEERTVFASPTSPTIWVQNAGETSVERIDLLPPETRLWGDIEAVGNEFRFQTRITDRDFVSWVSDGTPPGTVQEDDFLPPQSGVEVFGRKLVQDGNHIRYAGRILHEGPFDDAVAFEFEEKFYFTSDGDLYVSQGTSETTERIGTGVKIDSLTSWNGIIYFQSGTFLYSTSGTAATTGPVFSGSSRLRIRNPNFIVQDDQLLVFARDSNDINRNGLWRISDQHHVEFVTRIFSNLSDIEYFTTNSRIVYFDDLGSIFGSNGSQTWEILGTGWADNAIFIQDSVLAENEGRVFEASIDGVTNNELINLGAQGYSNFHLEGLRDGQLTFTAADDSIKQIDVSTNQVVEILEPILSRFKARDRLVLQHGPENYFSDYVDGRHIFYSWNAETGNTTVIGYFELKEILPIENALIFIAQRGGQYEVHRIDAMTGSISQIAGIDRLSAFRSAHISNNKLIINTTFELREIDLQTGQTTKIFQSESGNSLTSSWSARTGHLYVQEGTSIHRRTAGLVSWDTVVAHQRYFWNHVELPDGRRIANGRDTLFLFDDTLSPPDIFELPSRHYIQSIEIMDGVMLLDVEYPNSDRTRQLWRGFIDSTEFEFVDTGLADLNGQLEKLDSGNYLLAAGSKLLNSGQLSNDFDELVDIGVDASIVGRQNDLILGTTSSRLFAFSTTTNDVVWLLGAGSVENSARYSTPTQDGWLLQIEDSLFFTDGTLSGTDLWVSQGVESLQFAGNEVFVNGSLLEVVDRDLAPANFRVTTTADSGPGSLRQAILDASANPGFDHIRFDLPLGSVIQPTSPLPPITDPVYIGYSPRSASLIDSPAIQIDGSNAGPNATGLSLFADDIIIRELAITNFSHDGISVNRGNNVTLVQNQIGVDLAHNPGGNDRHGIRATATTNLQIQDNVIGANTREGIFLTGESKYSLISNNHIGLTPKGIAVGNNNGIVLHAAHNRVIDNVLAGNRRNGIGIFNRDGQHSLFRGNQFGFADDTSNFGNGDHGIYAESSNLLIGGLNEPNSFIGNRLAGIFLRGSNDSIISYNRIGSEISDLKNGANGIRAINTRRMEVFENAIIGNGSTGVYIGAGTEFSLVDNSVGILNDAPAGNTGFGLTLHSLKDSLIADNQIGGNLAGGVYSVSISRNSFLNNTVGTDASAMEALPNSPGGNGFAMILDGIDNELGQDGDGNTLANSSTNLLVRGDRNNIRGNRFLSTGDLLSRVHIFFAGSADRNSVEQNDFSKARLGIRNFTSNWNRFSENDFGVGLRTGIDNGSLGIQPNDVNDLDEGPNRGQNSPVIVDATASNQHVQIQYTLDVPTTSATYPLTIEFYKQIEDELGQFLIADLVFDNDLHSFQLSMELFELSVGDRIRAIAIDAEGNTSEFGIAAHIE